MQNKQAIVVGIAVLGASIAAFGQDDPQRRGRGNPMQATVEAFSLTEEQVDQIREIRRERPPRDQDQGEREAWRAEQKTRIQAVLTDEQKAEIKEAEEASAKTRALAGAGFLGLTDVPFPIPGGRGGWVRGPGRNREFRGPGRFRGRAAVRGGGRGWQGRGIRARRWGKGGRQASPPRGRRGGPDRDDRRGRRPTRD